MKIVFKIGNGVIPGALDVTIPTYVMRGTGSSTHYQYEINIVTSTERWSILRRYTKFRELYHHMKKKYGLKVVSGIFFDSVSNIFIFYIYLGSQITYLHMIG